jgi:hypothetical protein
MRNNQNNQSDKKPDNDGCLPVLQFWGGVIAFFLVCKWLESVSPGVGKWLLFGGLMTAIIGPLLYIIAPVIVGRTMKETFSNAFELIKVLVVFFVLLLILSPIIKCSNTPESSLEPTDMYFRE